jgi:hypothetical protein
MTSGIIIDLSLMLLLHSAVDHVVTRLCAYLRTSGVADTATVSHSEWLADDGKDTRSPIKVVS